MSIKRIVPDVTAERMDESKQFYTGLLGLQTAMDMGWIVTFTSPSNPTAQLTLLQASPAGPNPQISIEVENVDAVHAKVTAAGLTPEYPLTDEPWGVRRFFIRDPNGVLINVLSHAAPKPG
jgi:catechol 2,3-dioxygenase-like lactoylglutathione lyase family enzyme